MKPRCIRKKADKCAVLVEKSAILAVVSLFSIHAVPMPQPVTKILKKKKTLPVSSFRLNKTRSPIRNEQKEKTSRAKL